VVLRCTMPCWTPLVTHHQSGIGAGSPSRSGSSRSRTSARSSSGLGRTSSRQSVRSSKSATRTSSRNNLTRKPTRTSTLASSRMRASGHSSRSLASRGLKKREGGRLACCCQVVAPLTRACELRLLLDHVWARTCTPCHQPLFVTGKQRRRSSPESSASSSMSTHLTFEPPLAQAVLGECDWLDTPMESIMH